MEEGRNLVSEKFETLRFSLGLRENKGDGVLTSVSGVIKLDR